MLKPYDEYDGLPTIDAPYDYTKDIISLLQEYEARQSNMNMTAQDTYKPIHREAPSLYDRVWAVILVIVIP